MGKYFTRQMRKDLMIEKIQQPRGLFGRLRFFVDDGFHVVLIPQRFELPAEELPQASSGVFSAKHHSQIFVMRTGSVAAEWGVGQIECPAGNYGAHGTIVMQINDFVTFAAAINATMSPKGVLGHLNIVPLICTAVLDGFQTLTQPLREYPKITRAVRDDILHKANIRQFGLCDTAFDFLIEGVRCHERS